MTEIIEYCSNCNREVDMIWDIERDGYKAYCPHCGELLMLCSECPHRHEGDVTAACDFDGESDGCRFNENNLEHKSDVLEIIIHYGFSAQLDQLTEECAELIQAINKHKRACGNGQPVQINKLKALTNVLEEIADVEVVIDQLKAYTPDNTIIINDIKEKKIQRQLNRIKEETKE